MMHTTLFKAPISRKLKAGGVGLAALLMCSGLTACKNVTNADLKMTDTQISESTSLLGSTLPPIRTLLSCLPEDTAILAAHRGTDKSWDDQAENSIGALKKLINHGTLMAEIDLAGLKDDTLIIFHDGVWDEISTGKGPIASTTKADLEKILLISRAGKPTADRPPLFSDILKTAKNKMYLEIDFKSSADTKAVIKAIRDAGMADQVLLIAYTAKAAANLERLAPEMLRSNPTDAIQNTHAVWLGYDVANGTTSKDMKSKGNFTIGRIGDPNRQPPLANLIKASDILVTDYAERDDGIIGLTNQNRATLQACLAK